MINEKKEEPTIGSMVGSGLVASAVLVTTPQLYQQGRTAKRFSTPV